MLVAILGDIHSNLPALEEVLKAVKQEKVDKILCTGDIVGYGPYPAECIELVQDNNIIVVAGNHDYAVCGLIDDTFFTDDAKEVLEFTRSELTDSENSFLQNLVLMKKEESVNIVHSSFLHPELFEYVFDHLDLVENFLNLDTQIGFFGHTHFFKIYVKNSGDTDDYVEMKQNPFLYSDERILVNSGSVGQPRDGNTDTGYILLDTAKKIITIKRIPYNYNKTIQEMKHKNLPERLVERLLLGI